MTNLLLPTLALTLGLSASTQAFAYLMKLDPVLGAPLWGHGWVAVYGPWKILQWAWWARTWGEGAANAFVLPALVGVVSAGWTVYQYLPKRPKKGQAHWATEREVRQAELRGKTGIVLGWTGMLWWRTLLCYSGALHCFFVGRTGGGKTNTLTSTLYVYPHSALLNDPKNQLYTRTAGYRATLGPVVRFAPTETTTAGYNFWDRIDLTSDDAFREVDLLSHYLVGNDEQTNQSSAGILFEGLARQFLTGLSFYGLTTGLATCGDDFNDLVTLADWEGLCQSMAEHDNPLVQKAGRLGSKGSKGEVQDSLRITIERSLSIFNDPRVAAMTRTTTFPLAQLRDAARPCTVYWHVPFRDEARLKRLTKLFFHQVIDYCTQERFLLERQTAAAPCARPLLWVTEELPSLGHFTMATKGLNYVRDYGIQMLILTPSMEELHREYGTHHNFLEGTHIQAIFGLSDVKTAEPFAKRLGEHKVQRKRTTIQHKKRSTTIDTHKEALMDAVGITKLRPGKVLILAGADALVADQAPFYAYGPWLRESQRPTP